MTVSNSVKVPREPAAGRLAIAWGEAQFAALAADLFRLRLARGRGPQGAGTDVARQDWPPAGATEEQSAAFVELRTGAAALRLRRADLAPRLTLPDGAVALRAIDTGWLTADRRELTLRFELPDGARCLGFGARTGALDRRGRRVTSWATDARPDTIASDPLSAAIPFGLFVVEGRTLGVFVDHPGRAAFDLGKTDEREWRITITGSAVEIYLFSGPDAATVLDRYSELTGRPFLPPRWALGYHQSRWGYRSATDVVTLVREFRRRRIPCDAVYLDIDYMDRRRVFTWNRKAFPDPAGLIATLREENIRVVPIVDPGVVHDPRDATYRSGLAGRHFCRTPNGASYVGRVWPGATVFPDFERAATRRWWGARLTDALLNAGVTGIWNDMNEPSNFAPPKTLPGTVMQGDAGAERPHREVHNLYALRMAVATYEAQTAARPDERPFVVSRSGYAGIQRYAAMWLGDNRSSWDQLLASIPMTLGMGLSGVPFVGADVGGWDDDCTGELLVRWTQLGAFLPFFRNHCALGRHPQEPWAFGPEVEACCRAAIELRYRFLPYLERQFEAANRTGMPIARPLWLGHPEDEACADLSDEFLFGPDVLVAPAYQPGMRARAVYLPPGTWIDFHDRAALAGGNWIMAAAPLDRIPLFVRAGVTVPLLRRAPQHAAWTEANVSHVRFDAGAATRRSRRPDASRTREAKAPRNN